MSAINQWNEDTRAFLKKAREASATDGLLDDGVALEGVLIELLDRGYMINAPRDDPALLVLFSISKVLADDDQARVPIARIHEILDGYEAQVLDPSPSEDGPAREPSPSMAVPAMSSATVTPAAAPTSAPTAAPTDMESAPPLTSSPNPTPATIPDTLNSNSGDNLAEDENSVTAEEPRPKVSGKNVKLMDLQALLQRGPPKVVLTMRKDLAQQEKEKKARERRERRERREEKEMGKQKKRKVMDEEEFTQVEEEEVDDLADEVEEEDGMQVDKPKKGEYSRKLRKRRRVTSTATIASEDEDSDVEVQKKKMNRAPSWPTGEAPKPCEACISAFEPCETFVERSKGRQRKVCARCHRLKRKCSLADERQRSGLSKSQRSRSRTRSQREVKMEEESEDEDEEDEDEETAKKTGAKKGKGKARSQEEDDNDEEMVKKEELATEWQSVAGSQPGPSSRRLRRPRAGARDYAAIYTRLREVETQQEMVENVTVDRFQEINRQLVRLDSNAETQKKYFNQVISRVENKADQALQEAAGLQDQVDNVRKQTQAIHDHSAMLTKGLGSVIEGFNQLRFNLPGVFDDILKYRLGDGVTGQDLHQRSTSFSVIQPPPALHPLDSQPLAGPSQQTRPASLPSSQPLSAQVSPSKFFPQYMHGDPNHGMADLQVHLDEEDRQMDVDMVDGHRDEEDRSGDGEAVAEPVDTTDTMAKGAEVEGGNSQPVAQMEMEEGSCEDVAESVDNSNGSDSSSPKEDPDEPMAGDGSAGCLDDLFSVNHSQEQETPPQPIPTNIIPPTPTMELMTAPSPSPAIVQSQRVNPPVGMLTGTPPSSQDTTPSSPSPAYQMLARGSLAVPVPATAVTAPFSTAAIESNSRGPVTRSRSGSATSNASVIGPGSAITAPPPTAGREPNRLGPVTRAGSASTNHPQRHRSPTPARGKTGKASKPHSKQG